MGYVDEKVEELEYYMSLLLMTLDKHEFPFFYLVMSRKVKKREIETLLHTCERLSESLHIQKQEGFLCYESLFQEFQVVVPPILEVQETIEALEGQKLYKSLISELKKYL